MTAGGGQASPDPRSAKGASAMISNTATFSKTVHQSMTTGATNPARKLFSKQGSTVSQRDNNAAVSSLMPAVALASGSNHPAAPANN